MALTLLFITGVLAGLIAGFILSRVFGRSRSGGGSGEIRLLEERLLKADQGLAQFSQQLEAQSSELRAAQQQGLPVLLLSDAADLVKGAEAVCWVFDPSKAFSAFQATVS